MSPYGWYEGVRDLSLLPPSIACIGRLTVTASPAPARLPVLRRIARRLRRSPTGAVDGEQLNSVWPFVRG